MAVYTIASYVKRISYIDKFVYLWMLQLLIY